MNGYLTAAGYGEAEIEDKRSRFLAHVRPVSSETEAKAFLEAVRAKYPDATHHVYAYLLREGNILRWSDDGEPGGTSGQPTLSVLQGAGLVVRGALVEEEEQVALPVLAAQRIQHTAHAHPHAELLRQLAAQGLLRALARLQLPAGEFPLARQPLTLRPLAGEIAPPAAQHPRDHKDPVHLVPSPSAPRTMAAPFLRISP